MNYESIYNAIGRRNDKINYLKGLLSSTDSPVGDWKVVKIYEARMSKEADPYDFGALTANRQLVRNEINRLQALSEEEET